MLRLLLLITSCTFIFVGFSVPFLLQTGLGMMMAIVLLISGVALLWFVEIKTQHSLEKETPLNMLLKADGNELIERK